MCLCALFLSSLEKKQSILVNQFQQTIFIIIPFGIDKRAVNRQSRKVEVHLFGKEEADLNASQVM